MKVNVDVNVQGTEQVMQTGVAVEITVVLALGSLTRPGRMLIRLRIEQERSELE